MRQVESQNKQAALSHTEIEEGSPESPLCFCGSPSYQITMFSVCYLPSPIRRKGGCVQTTARGQLRSRRGKQQRRQQAGLRDMSRPLDGPTEIGEPVELQSQESQLATLTALPIRIWSLTWLGLPPFSCEVGTVLVPRARGAERTK